VKDSEETARCYQLADAKPFFDQVKALMTAEKAPAKPPPRRHARHAEEGAWEGTHPEEVDQEAAQGG
jgi:hypothetical protein